MITWIPCGFSLLWLVLPYVPVVAVTPNDKEIARLVKHLDSVVSDREAATKRLKEIGEPALDALGKAKDTLEVRRRAEENVTGIEAH